jgi:hypothetical protein
MAAWIRPRFWLSFFTRFECQECASERGYPSRPRNFVERSLIPLLLLRPVRCGDCYQRSWCPFTVALMRRTALETNQ